MDRAKVYFTDLRTKPGKNLLDKLKKLVLEAGIKEIDFKGQLVALKIHFGEPGNLSYIRSNYVACIVKLIKELGGKPFLTDANTLYSGKRANAVDHLNTAMENGFNRIAVGCDVIIADGLKGTEYREILINKKHCTAPKIATAIADADIIISLTHFKGHEMTGFGGTLKNLGMGSGSRAGKMEM
ncbi:MAG: 4Fe-4S ferredoxin, partial [Candidatus Infernicultor aquiphilus]